MIKQLYIKDFTLIDELNISFGPGFSVITGETGAGKSIIIGAIGLLLGNRADARQIKEGREKCIVEAHFDISSFDIKDFFAQNDIDYDETDCIIRREVNIKGKSRAFINDTPAPLSLLRELGNRLIDIHSQHQNLLLRKEDFQMDVVDIIAHDNAALQDYQKSYEDYISNEKELKELQEKIAKAKENEDFLRFQCQELENCKLQETNQKELEQESQTLSHAEEIKSALYECDTILSNDDNSILGNLKRVIQHLNGIEEVYPTVIELRKRLDSLQIELKDIAAEINKNSDNIDFDPQRLEAINDTLDNLYAIEQKYHVESTDELIEKLNQIKEQLHDIDYSDEELENKKEQCSQAQKKAEEKAKVLTELRKKAAVIVEKELRKRLIPLGIPNIRFEVKIEDKPLSSNGKDKVQFLFSANKSSQLMPVAQIASGGEIARVMLSLKAMISGATKQPTIIFDEIDTGVSGKIAEKMADIMKEMGSGSQQVISITHLPQIAAMGTAQYKVSKEETPQGTVTTMRPLNQEERIKEIAQMLSGSVITPAAINNAKSLLQI